MKCKHCGYLLWRLKERQCPECGTPFHPSEYKFRPGAVRFCCQHCGQAYYGTSGAGLLEPRSFDCEGCRHPVDMDEMVLEPEPGREDDAMAMRVVPWQDRAAGHWLRRLWLTAKMGMISPSTLLADSDSARAGPATGYFMTLAGANMLVAFVSVLLFLAVMMSVAGGAPPGTFGLMGVGMCCQFVAGFAVWLVLLVLWTLGSHLILKFTGQKRGDFSRTWTALAYASGPLVLGLIPLCGVYLSTPAYIWWMVSAVFTMRSMQEVSTGRAVCAVIIPPIAMTVLAGLLYILFIVGFMASIAQMNTGARQVMGQANGQSVGTALLASRSLNGQWPTHIGELIVGGTLSGSQLTGPSGVTGWQSTIGGQPLLNFDALTYEQRTQAVAAEVRGMASVSQYRVGDFVFCYAGLDPMAHDPALWIAVVAPTDTDMWGNEVKVGYAVRLDGLVVEIDHDDMAALLDEQNDIREVSGLTPIEDPFAVLPDYPVRGLPVESELDDDGG